MHQDCQRIYSQSGVLDLEVQLQTTFVNIRSFYFVEPF